jgi:8-oxo-dGTP pyrophosphatase MutT (NUDIX family)
MAAFVVGLYFSMDLQQFVLIEKRKESTYFGGRWNGVGGRIQQHEQIVRQVWFGNPGNMDNPSRPADFNEVALCPETPHHAMAREFGEETGVYTEPKNWHCFHIQNWEHTKNKVYWMYSAGPYINQVKTITDEKVAVWDMESLIFDNPKKAYDLMYHLYMCLAHVRKGDIFCLNPEGVNGERTNPVGLMGPDVDITDD